MPRLNVNTNIFQVPQNTGGIVTGCTLWILYTSFWRDIGIWNDSCIWND